MFLLSDSNSKTLTTDEHCSAKRRFMLVTIRRYRGSRWKPAGRRLQNHFLISSVDFANASVLSGSPVSSGEEPSDQAAGGTKCQNRQSMTAEGARLQDTSANG